MKGANLRTSVHITFEEAVFGTSKTIELNVKEECKTCHGTGAKEGTQPITCPKCGGKGQVVFTQQSFFGTVRNVQTCPDCNGTGKVIKDKCTDCHGSGYVPMKKRFEVDIPAGIDNGQCKRLAGMGEPGVNGGPRGDVLVEVIVGRHPIFQRQDYNIYSTVPVSFAVAALGGEVVIDTVDGKVIYDVKPGTQTDTKIRLKGKGVPNLRNKEVRGDHYVTLVVQVPDKLSGEARNCSENSTKFPATAECGEENGRWRSCGRERKEEKRILEIGISGFLTDNKRQPAGLPFVYSGVFPEGTGR